MSPLQRKLAAYSRDRNFLIRAAITIIAVCVVLGFVVSKFAREEQNEEELREQLVHGLISYESERDREELGDLLLGRGQPTPEALAHYVTFFETFVTHNLIQRSTDDAADVRQRVPTIHGVTLAIETHSESLTDDQKTLFLNYTNALYATGEEKSDAVTALQEQAAAQEPVRFANEFLGQVIASNRDRRAEALPHFQSEVEDFPRSDFSRFRLLDLNLALGNNDTVGSLLADPSYRGLVSPRFAMDIGVRLPSPGLVIDGVWRAFLLRLGSNATPLALFASMIWFCILSKLGGVRKLLSGRLLLFALALVAGFFSVPLTHIFITIQEDVFGFVENGEFVNDLLYCISGIGLREEIAKIILFLPFVPFIAKNRTQLEILIAAGCIGLGFATIENIGYFSRSGPGEAFPRLLSAAFLHISLTGLLGLAVCRFWHYPKRCWEELVGTFVGVILIHGFYDAFIIVPELSRQLGILTFIILVVTVRFYFKRIADTRGQERHVVSPLGIFVIGSSLVIGAAWIFAMRYYQFDHAMEGVGKGALLSGVLAFLYINEFRNE